MANGNFSDLVTNSLMKKVLFDTSHMCYTLPSKNYNNKNMWRVVRGSGATDMKPSPTGKCTNGPATWYRNAGIPIFFWSNPSKATVSEMKHNLTKAGFQQVWSGTGQQANTLLASLGILRPGDVATMLSSNSAHAAMWTGQDWRSDFVQNNPYPYSSVGRGGNETFILWRHPQLLSGLQVTQQLVNQSKTNNTSNIIKWRSERPNKTSKWGIPTDLTYIDDNALSFIKFLINKGLSLEAACGIAGNIMSESGFNPYNYVVNDNGGPSGGIAMWHNKRLQRLKNYATKRGKNWQDIETLANYLWYELTEGGYKHVLNKLKNVKSVEDASFIWGDEFEVFDGHQNRNGKNHRNRRNNALTFANEYKKYNNVSPQYAQITPQKSLTTQNNLLKMLQDSMDNLYNTLNDSQMNYESSYDYLNSIRDNFNKTFFPIIDTELNNFSDYTIDSNRKGKYSTVDYYSILTDFLQNNTNKFLEGGTIFSKLDTLSKKLQVPTYNTIDYAGIINKVWNSSNGFIKPEDTPITFGNNIDFTKFNISPTDVESSTNQNIEYSSTALSSTQDTDELNLEKIDQTFLQLDFNSKQYKGGRMGHPEDTNYEDDVYYNPTKENNTSNKGNNYNKKVSLGHPEDINYEDEVYYNPSIETLSNSTTAVSPTVTEQLIIPIQDQLINPTNNQTPIITVNDYRGNLPVSAELDVYLKAIKDIQNNNYLSFALAFRLARNSGLKTFTWRGKLYTTLLAKRSSRRKTYTYKKNKRK